MRFGRSQILDRRSEPERVVSIDIGLAALKQLGEVRHDYRPPTDDEIVSAEEILGARFPTSYITFLKEWEGHVLDGWEPLAIDGTMQGSLGIVNMNRELRTLAHPRFLIAFYDIGCGDYQCFDSRTRDEKGECLIYLWRHRGSRELKLLELGDGETDHGDSFAQWLHEEVDT